MSNFTKLLMGSATALLIGCENPDAQKIVNETEDMSPIAEQETGSPYYPAPLSVSAIGRVEAAPDIAVVTGLIEVEEDSHDGAYARVADIINLVQQTADTEKTEMSYTQVSASDVWDEDCLKENKEAQTRHYQISSAQRHNKSVRNQIKTQKEQMQNAEETFEEERLTRQVRIRKLRQNRDIPEFRIDLFEEEEGLEDFQTDFKRAQKQRDERLTALEKSIKDVEPRRAQKTCTVLNVKAQMRFTARIHPAEKAPDFMNAFTQAGVSKVNLYGYDFSDYDAVYQKAAERAVEGAREKARLIAERSGTRLKKVQSFSVSQPTRFGRFGPQSKSVVTQPRYVNYVSVPPVFETYTEAVTVQEASTELVTIPPTYETVTETVVVQNASAEFVTIPATYKTVVETFVVQPAYEYNGQKVPAVTKQITRRVVDVPARTVEKAVPAVTKQVSRRVIKTPASTRERIIPAVTKMETRRRIKTPARTIEQVVPAQTKQVFTSGQNNNALRQSVLSGPQMVEVSAHMVFDYETALDDVRIRN